MPYKQAGTLSVFCAVLFCMLLSSCIPVRQSSDTSASGPSPDTDQAPAPAPLKTPPPEQSSEPTPQPEAQPEPASEPQPETPPAAVTEPEPTPEPLNEPEPAAIPEPEPVAPLQTEPELATSRQPQAEPLPELPPSATSAPENSTLRGRLTLIADDSDYLESEGIRDAVIYYVPDGGAPAVLPGSFEISTQNKRLEPDVLAVTVGSEVVFPNRDDILHNVFSVSSAAMFDLGLISAGQSASQLFSRPGHVLVHCNVHHAMRADILVLDTPFFAQPDLFGNFQIEDLPSGSGKLHLWHPQTAERVWTISVPAAGALDFQLTLTRPRVPPHLNKFGESYRPERPGG